MVRELEPQAQAQHQSKARVRVSVIIPTRNRRELLRKAIASVFRQTLSPNQFELIVVDNCSEDGTTEMMAEIAKAAPCSVHYYRSPINQGAIHSRNTGAGMAEGEFLAFTDSDCEVSPQWLERGIHRLQGNDAGFASGLVLNKPGQKVTFFCVGAGALPGENPTYPTANIMYRAAVFRAMGGFDDSVWFADFKDQHLECGDTDLAWRTKEQGYKNAFDDQMIVYHEVRQVDPITWLQNQMRVCMIPELAKRHPDFRRIFFWWGPFAFRDNVILYLGLLGLALAIVVSPRFLLFDTPLLIWLIAISWANKSAKSVLRWPARLIMILARQFLICGSLWYGSYRSRTFVL